ncbi:MULTISPECIES: HlyD family secretion protein [unclassified Pseudoalteromonas]|uniref:HlyD family secretion protein n=1 Tax=unclassified Pseudoalteromonas TaxID=194690 RepID=UPI001F2B9F49|nr:MULTISPECIES: HlyD family efflux transporter periplasmic adaptor subunit [unclassified Pseudoalteromonas]MCF2829494.1 HlyD family efflux transporter periplasmic adaptor subunit [Pseudoalteromonas sp. OF5H-5]MCF2831600.1 HlyD family efflux transporter periplasmic adaptor subunit [Pseudoalteromonas sp. DL2-H6]MCF2927700.1 HlyD family efflux transporter periplasmic adaptor subunit [Pseudoalteromonas sp. DL2-H1]
MDVIKKKQAKPLRKLFILISIPVVLVSIWFMMGKLSDQTSTKLERHSIIIGNVQRGNLDVEVTGYGVLRSNKQKLITAQDPATVNEILVRPGGEVLPDTIILKMQDPDLTQQLASAEMELNRQKANFRRQKLANQRELLMEAATLAELKSEHQSLAMRREAQQELRDQGVVPAIEVKTAELEERQLAERVKLQHQRIEQLKLLHKEDLTISQELINQANSILARLIEREAKLTVRAGTEGVLQRLAVELGQSVVAGQELAQVGSSADLQALVRVSQSKAEQIRVGQPAVVNTRREKVQATVTRISPQVQEGTIEVELTFNDAVPESARPELNVDATIMTHSLQDVLYVERPSNTHPHSQQSIFVLDSAGEYANSTSVSFGIDAGNYIQIEEGIGLDQQVILSDTTSFKTAQKIRIIQ